MQCAMRPASLLSEASKASERRQAGRIAPCICYRKRVLLDLQEHHPEASKASMAQQWIAKS